MFGVWCGVMGGVVCWVLGMACGWGVVGYEVWWGEGCVCGMSVVVWFGGV